jgi:hypothetical protein
MTEVGDQKSEGRGQMADVKSQRAEDRRQKKGGRREEV